MIGKRLAHYDISSQLGKVGMGEVYQAKDQKPGRDVAIKVLPDEFASDADRVARFRPRNGLARLVKAEGWIAPRLRSGRRNSMILRALIRPTASRRERSWRTWA